MTSSLAALKELRKFVESQQDRMIQKQTLLFERLRNKPFWILSKEEHQAEYQRTKGDCCATHILGLPQKDNKRLPLFPYEKIIYDALQEHKYIWIKKSTGLGVTEMILRYMIYLATRDDTYRNTQMPIICGPNQDIAIKLIKRIKTMFEPHGVLFDSKETVAMINNCTIEAYPSNHLDAYRSLERPKFIFLDESDFFRISDQADARNVSEMYIAKSDPYIVMVSTPNAPGGLFETIEREPQETCLYHRLFFDFTYGVNYIYTAEEIDKARRSPGFLREYALQYLGGIGNVFSVKDIELAIEKGQLYDPDNFNPYSHFSSVSLGIDPGYGSSQFAFVVTQWQDGHIQILHAEEFQRPDFNEMISVAYGLISKYQVNKTYVDGANPSFIRSLKLQIGEDADYDELIARYKSQGLGDATENMKVVPVHFNSEHKSLLSHCKMILEETEPRRLAINPKFQNLITSLRTAVANDGALDKEQTSFNDILDAFRLALKYYKFEEA